MNGKMNERRNWTRSLTVLLLVVLVGVLIGCLADKGEQGSDRLYLQSSAGPVLFDHQSHQEQAESCAQCHHELYGGEQATSCEDCHDDGFIAGEFSHAELKDLHSFDCARCHQQLEDDEMAASCRQCHPATQAPDTATKSCAECHDDSYMAEMMEHDAYMEVSKHSCLGCHSPQPVAKVYHTSCSNCHLLALPKRFATADGEVSCGACHLR